MRKDVLKSIECILNKVTGIPQLISEDTVLYGVAENKINACSLELAYWFVEIESEYNIEIPVNTIKVRDIIDTIVGKRGEDR